jgi:hypothetical protein
MFSSNNLIDTLTSAASVYRKTVRYVANHSVEAITLGLVISARVIDAAANTCPTAIVPFTCPTDIDLYSPYFDVISNLDDWHKANLFVFAQSHDVVVHEAIAANMINYFSKGKPSFVHLEGASYETTFNCEDYCLEEIKLTHRILINHSRDICIPHIIMDPAIQCRGWERKGNNDTPPELLALSKKNDIAVKQMPILQKLLSECFDMNEELYEQTTVVAILKIAIKMIDAFNKTYTEYFPQQAKLKKPQLTAQKKYFTVHLHNLINKNKNTFDAKHKDYDDFLVGFNDMVSTLANTITLHNQTQTEFTKKIMPYAIKRDQEGLLPSLKKSKKLRGKKFFTAGVGHILTNAGTKTLFTRNTTHLLSPMKKVLEEQDYTVIAFKK